MDDQSIWMQMWTENIREAVQKQLLFVASESVLFLGFATLLSTGGSWFCRMVALLGLFSCLMGFFHILEPAKRLRELEKEVPDGLKPLWTKTYGRRSFSQKVGQKIAQTRWASVFIPAFFGILWLFSVLYSFGILR